MAPANTPEGWWASEDLAAWGPPLAVVRGEHHYLDALRQVLGTEDTWRPGSVALRREPDNAFDANAIRVEAAEQHVGFIAAELAEQLAPYADSIGCSMFAGSPAASSRSAADRTCACSSGSIDG